MASILTNKFCIIKPFIRNCSSSIKPKLKFERSLHSFSCKNKCTASNKLIKHTSLPFNSNHLKIQTRNISTFKTLFAKEL